jgi:hypothetical protein
MIDGSYPPQHRLSTHRSAGTSERAAASIVPARPTTRGITRRGRASGLGSVWEQALTMIWRAHPSADWGSKLCHAIVDPPRLRHHLSEGMPLAALQHTEMAGELTMFQAAVSSAAESVLGRSPDDTSRVEVVVSWLSNSRRSRIGVHSLSGLPQGSVTCSLGHHLVRPDWSIISMRSPNSLEWSCLPGGRWMQSWRLCRLRLHEFGTWCLAAQMGHLL